MLSDVHWSMELYLLIPMVFTKLTDLTVCTFYKNRSFINIIDWNWFLTQRCRLSVCVSHFLMLRLYLEQKCRGVSQYLFLKGYLAQQCRGVSQYLFLVLMAAPLLSRNFTMSSLPLDTARNSGVRPIRSPIYGGELFKYISLSSLNCLQICGIYWTLHV